MIKRIWIWLIKPATCPNCTPTIRCRECAEGAAW